MTVDDVRAMVGTIRAEAADDESAHSDEDDLHRAVLREIADGQGHAADLAREALVTTEIEFARWYA